MLALFTLSLSKKMSSLINFVQINLQKPRLKHSTYCKKKKREKPRNNPETTIQKKLPQQKDFETYSKHITFKIS